MLTDFSPRQAARQGLSSTTRDVRVVCVPSRSHADELLLINLNGVTSSRCWRPFLSATELGEHQRLFKSHIETCLTRSPPPQGSSSVDVENGVTSNVADRLVARANGLRVGTWGDLWHLLFPDDQVVPPPSRLISPVLLPELKGHPLTLI